MTNTDAQKEADAAWKVVGEMLAIAGLDVTTAHATARMIRLAVRADLERLR